jgi:hypothetical protein
MSATTASYTSEQIEIAILRALLKRGLQNREISLNPHHLGNQADRIAETVGMGLDRQMVLHFMQKLYEELAAESFEKAKTASGGH